MHRGASSDAIRTAYRDRALRHHPDRAGDPVATELMSAVNEAYRVLGDPGRRALYDHSLLSGRQAATVTDEEEAVSDDRAAHPTEATHSRLSPSGPARVPWRLMFVTALIGSVVVFVAAAFNDPPSEEEPDGILRAGSCVEIEPNGDAREVACTGDQDVMVDLVLPTGARCPAGAVAHRDRLGLGTACIRI